MEKLKIKIQKIKENNFLNANKDKILFAIIFAVAFAARIILFGKHPGGINQDEASIGYDAWALLNYGMDRNGFTLPVHLLAWGSGQNALYAYLSMPFIAVFGLNIYSVRAVNLLFSLLTVVLMYFTVRHFKGKRAGFIAMALAAAAPWSIMSGRWGLEANIFPVMLLLLIWAVSYATEKPRYLYAAAVIAALSLYSYGPSYLVITLFVLVCFIYFIIKKLAPLKTLIIAAIVFLIISTPIYIFVIINFFQFDSSVFIGPISIPRLYGNRIEAQGGTTFYDFFRNIFYRFFEQTDTYERNAFTFYGCIYVISAPFWAVGIYRFFKSKTHFDFIVLAALACTITMFFYYKDPNINRISSIYIPLLFFTAVGIADLATDKRRLAAIAVAYAICFSGFLTRYFGNDFKNYSTSDFFDTFDEALAKATSLAHKERTISVTTQPLMPYIYALYVSKTPPQEFTTTASISNPGSMFQEISSFSNYVFDNAEGLNYGAPGIYVIENERIPQAQSKTTEIYKFERYSVAVIN